MVRASRDRRASDARRARCPLRSPSGDTKATITRTVRFPSITPFAFTPSPATNSAIGKIPAGRDPRAVGLEVWVSTGEGGPEDWRKQFQVWKDAGVTHVTVNSCYSRGPHKRIAGKTVSDHMAAMKQYHAAVADLL